jgi:addiction module HigA family antidote
MNKSNEGAISKNFLTSMGSRPISPGEILAIEMNLLGTSVDEFSEKLQVRRENFIDILSGERSIDSFMARRLADFFGTSPTFWTDQQFIYDFKRRENCVN